MHQERAGTSSVPVPTPQPHGDTAEPQPRLSISSAVFYEAPGTGEAVTLANPRPGK